MSVEERDIAWQRDVSPAAWIAPRLHGWAEDVGSVVPAGFAAYARVLHPVEHDGSLATGPQRRWSEIARQNGRVVHAEAQFQEISRPVGAAPSEASESPATGTLPWPERRVLVDILAEETRTPERCWFCMWEGFSLLDQGITERVELPRRSYFFYGGDIEMAFALPPEHGGLSYWRRAGEAPPSEAEKAEARRRLNSRRSPNLWWPDDRAWCVATEIDFGWTYVGGTARAIARVLANPDLEALLARPSDKPFHDSDWLNAALDVP
jgi:hypothetical protein